MSRYHDSGAACAAAEKAFPGVHVRQSSDYIAAEVCFGEMVALRVEATAPAAGCPADEWRVLTQVAGRHGDVACGFGDSFTDAMVDIANGADHVRFREQVTAAFAAIDRVGCPVQNGEVMHEGDSGVHVERDEAGNVVSMRFSNPGTYLISEVAPHYDLRPKPPPPRGPA